jgi:hypothetical protein
MKRIETKVVSNSSLTKLQLDVEGFSLSFKLQQAGFQVGDRVAIVAAEHDHGECSVTKAPAEVGQRRQWYFKNGVTGRQFTVVEQPPPPNEKWLVRFDDATAGTGEYTRSDIERNSVLLAAPAPAAPEAPFTWWLAEIPAKGTIRVLARYATDAIAEASRQFDDASGGCVVRLLTAEQPIVDQAPPSRFPPLKQGQRWKHQRFDKVKKVWRDARSSVPIEILAVEDGWASTTSRIPGYETKTIARGADKFTAAGAWNERFVYIDG